MGFWDDYVESVKEGLKDVGKTDTIQHLGDDYHDWAARNPEKARSVRKGVSTVLKATQVVPGLGELMDVLEPLADEGTREMGKDLKK